MIGAGNPQNNRYRLMRSVLRKTRPKSVVPLNNRTK